MSDDAFEFEHELLFDYFRAEHLRREMPAVHSLGAELRKPRNRTLFEFVLPRYEQTSDVVALLPSCTDVEILSKVIAGECGVAAKAALLEQCLVLMAHAQLDLPNVRATCHTHTRQNDRKVVGALTLQGKHDWTAWDRLLPEAHC